jgi:hypothetical protein
MKKGGILVIILFLAILAFIAIGNYSSVSNEAGKISNDSLISKVSEQVLIISAPSNLRLHEILDKIVALDEYSPKAFGLNFYYDTSLFFHKIKTPVISIGEVIPFDEDSAGYLYLDMNYEKYERNVVDGFYPYYFINGTLKESFALRLVREIDFDVQPSSDFIQIADLRIIGDITIADFESVMERPDLVANKVVLIGYIGDISPDPNILDFEDIEVYETPVGKMYDTILQANFIIELILRFKSDT